MDEKLLTQFEAYLNQEMSKAQQAAFDAKLATDADFKADFELYKKLNNFLAYKFANEDAEKELRNTLNRLQEKKMERKAKVVPLFSLKKILVAASVVLLVTLSVYKFTQKPSFADFAHYDELTLTVRGDDETQLKMLEKYFNNKQFNKALPLFESLLKENPNDKKLLLYKALALVETNKINESLALFDKLITSDNVLYKDNALWYKSLAYLKVKDYKQCKIILEQLSTNSDYAEEAKELLNSL